MGGSVSRPTLSVIVPSRNGMPYLKEALSSLEIQTEWPDSVVLSDNFSQDETATVMKDFALRHKYSNYFVSTEYLEFGNSFNFAISHSIDDWVYFLHSDDILSPKAIYTIRSAISKAGKDVALISFGAELIDEESNLIRAKFGVFPKKYIFGKKFIEHNLGGSSINFGAVVINRRIFHLLGGFDVSNSYWLDLKYYHKLVLNYKILKLSKPILRYRVHASIRDADGRLELGKNNVEYWNNAYLPKLIEDLELFIPSPDARQSVFIKLKLVLKRQNTPYKFMERLLVKLRIFCDTLGVGQFSKS